MFRFHPSPNPVGKRAMTLVEVMMAFAVFAIAVVGGLSAIIFSLRNVDSARTEAQVTQILVNEMEAMRLRKWNTDIELKAGPPPLILQSLTNMIAGSGTAGPLPPEVEEVISKYEAGGTLPSPRPPIKKSAFVPFAVYGVNPNPGTGTPPVATVGNEVAAGIGYKLRTEGMGTAAAEYSRYLVGPFTLAAANQNAALIILYVKWQDIRGTHSKTFSYVVPSKGFSHD